MWLSRLALWQYQSIVHILSYRLARLDYVHPSVVVLLHVHQMRPRFFSFWESAKGILLQIFQFLHFGLLM